MVKKTVVIAAGGTGGHLFPAEALAQELAKREYNIVMITDKRGDAFKSLGNNIKVETIKSATFKSGLISKIKTLFMLKLGVIQSFLLFIKYRPSIVIGFGGYPSFPPVITAQILCLKNIIVEQNAVLGKANICLASLATRIATTLENTKSVRDKDKKKIVVTGNPVRANICDMRDKEYPEISDTINILLTGGSQGAKVFSDIVPPVIIALSKKINKKIKIVQQCKSEDINKIRDEYKKANIEAQIDSFIYDMAEKLQQSHIFIGRSGAATVAELAVVGRPAIFVPLAVHKDYQQMYNAKIIADNGGAWIIEEKDFTESSLLEMLENLANNKDMLENAAIASKRCGKPEAVINLANLVERTIN